MASYIKISTAQSASSYYAVSHLSVYWLLSSSTHENSISCQSDGYHCGGANVPAWAEPGSSETPARSGSASAPASSQPPAGSSALAPPHPGGCVMLWTPRKHWDPKHPTFRKWRETWSISALLLLAYEANAHFWFYLTVKGKTYTCFAPAFIFKSCLISLMMHFRSLPVHLQCERRWRDGRHLTELLSSWKKKLIQASVKESFSPSVGFKCKWGYMLLVRSQRHKRISKRIFSIFIFEYQN